MTSSYIGVDLGTSGVRAVIIDDDCSVLASAESSLGAGQASQTQSDWWCHTKRAIRAAVSQTSPNNIKAISVSGTSGTVMALDASLRPMSRVFMYSDRCQDLGILDKVKELAPDWSPARSGCGGLACILELLKDKPTLVLHQADWLNFNLTGRFIGDASNSLKSGYDPISACWPEWVTSLGFSDRFRGTTVASGLPMATLSKTAANTLGLSTQVMVVAGTTDGCASFLATGASKIGDGVTVLGTTLTIKLLSKHPIFDPTCGVYSHRIGDMWLAGGASNTGGGALLKHFSLSELKRLGSSIDVREHTGLEYYPLPGIGERFPISDPDMESRHDPIPADPERFLRGLLEGITHTEKMAYERLCQLGAPKARRIFATGGGSKNAGWMKTRERDLAASIVEPLSVDAAFGAALLALNGFNR